MCLAAVSYFICIYADGTDAQSDPRLRYDAPSDWRWKFASADVLLTSLPLFKKTHKPQTGAEKNPLTPEPLTL